MRKTAFVCFCIFFLVIDFSSFAQVAEEDSFFLVKKKGILGKLGRTISVNVAELEPVKTVNPFKSFGGKTIRSINVEPLGFGKNPDSVKKLNLAERAAKRFHKTTREHIIRNHLFFKEGQKLAPLLVADNERYLREQAFLQDAYIILHSLPKSDSVDVIVITKDVFSIGGGGSASSSRVKMELKEENFAGTGNKFSVSSMFDKDRAPGMGIGADFIKRNIRGKFIDWAGGFTTFSPGFNTGRLEEQKIYTAIEKPMASRYTEWTGSAEISYNKTYNAYADTLYKSDVQYRFIRTDAWAGYNLGFKSGKLKDSEQRLRHLVAARKLFNHFYDVPQRYDTLYNYNYADLNAMLFSYSLYRQNFYRTNFIYGFGRNEDVPEGINATVVAGVTNKQGVKRSYYGAELDMSRYSAKNHFTAYSFKIGGFVNKGKWQDIDILLGANHFTRLRSMSVWWLNRNFVSMSITRQIKPFLNTPLLLESNYGLPYFRNGGNEADVRATVKLESVYYHLRRYLGFRFAPFVFTDGTLLKQINESFKRSNIYTALGAGVRIRNENLVFGTIELKGYVFPRVTADMNQNWRVEATTRLQFKYNSSFIRKPDFILPN